MKESTKRNWESFWARKSNLSEVYPNSDRIRKNLASVTSLHNKRVLEIGAGTGRDSFYMCDDGAKLFLLDYSKNSLHILRSNKPDAAQAFVIGGDAFRLPFPDGSFDVVFHQGLLEHFREPSATHLLEENVRVLKSGGFLVVDVPQRWHVYTIIKHILIAFNAWFAGWEREFSASELESKIRTLNLQHVKTYGEWMVPSLFYRMIREAGLKFGLRLPLYPRLSSATQKLRLRFRQKLEGSSVQINTSLSVGIIAVKP